MNSPRYKRDLAVRYLLGEVSEQEREVVAGRLFNDDQFAETLEAVECDLLDAYARGDLNPSDRAAVELHLLASEGQLEKLRLARALANRELANSLRSRVPVRSISRPLMLTAAAVTVLCAAGLWVMKHNAPPPRPQAPVARQTLPQSAPPAPVFAALLSPDVTRDAQVQQVTLPPNAATVVLDLSLPDEATAASYTIRFIRQRETVYEEKDLIPHREAGMRLLSVVLPSSVLLPGPYRIKAIPTGSGGPATDSPEYYFLVR